MAAGAFHWSIFEVVIVALARIRVRLALEVAYRIGSLASRLGIYGFAPGRFASLIGNGNPAELASAAREASAGALVGRAIHRIRTRLGHASIAGLVDEESLTRLREIAGPGNSAMFVSTHATLTSGLASWFERAGCDFRTFQIRFRRQPASSLGVSSSASSRLSGLKNAIDHLRRGGIVLMTADTGVGTSWVEVKLLGRPTRFLRGAAAIARASRAPIRPIIAFWDPAIGSVRIEIFEPVDESGLDRSDPVAFDEALLQRLADRFTEAYRQHPSALINDVTSGEDRQSAPSVPDR